MKTHFHNDYNNMISIENLFQVWKEFRRGKKKRYDIQVFERHLENNLFILHQSLKNKTYSHGTYNSFYVQDPKQRHIHKASVKDRIAHHLLYNYLYEFFNKSFIFDSYSCRLNKGTHKAVERLEIFTRKVSKNYTKICWSLKLDIKKFFASIDHKILIGLLKSKIRDKNILWLLKEIIESFYIEKGKGMPLGNLTSQVFANIYLNKLDQFIKHILNLKYYIRYADDIIILSSNKDLLQKLIELISTYLENNLNLTVHPNKIILRRLDWGLDFLGYIILPYYRLPRTKTKRRIFNKLIEKVNTGSFEQSLQSYLGYLKHASSYKIILRLKNQIKLYRSNNLYI